MPFNAVNAFTLLTSFKYSNNLIHFLNILLRNRTSQGIVVSQHDGAYVEQFLLPIWPRKEVEKRDVMLYAYS